MADVRVRNLPTEVQLALEVMPCQAMRRVHEPAAQPHPCAYFAEWGSYHSYDYASAGAPDQPNITEPLVYAGKTALAPEILSGCRKAPIMAVGINPNLPGYWPSSRNAINPLFDDFLQYAHYFRYRGVAKLAIPKAAYDQLRDGREDSSADPSPLTEVGAAIPAEPVALRMYTSYQSLLDGLAAKMGWNGHRLAVGEDLSYANMVACPSAKWVVKADPANPELPVMGPERMRGIVRECFHDRRYFLRQLFQSLPVALLVFSESTGREFIAAMQGRFTAGEPRPDERLADLLAREIRLGYGITADGEPLEARVVFLPHASANPEQFERFKGPVIDILAEEVTTGRLRLNPQTGHLARPRGGCVFCSNDLYSIGPCDYAGELRPLAAQDPAQEPAQEPAGELPMLATAGQAPGAVELPMAAAAGGAPGAVERENAEQARLIEEFLPPMAPAPELASVDGADSPPLVLLGRIVTMNADGEVIDDGALYLQDGQIAAVARRADPPPDGFAHAVVLDTRGTIYPGLLDLHNHLVYNIATLWRAPRAFANRDQWQRNTSYREQITMPLGVLASDRDTVKAIVRYVEVKVMLGGATSVQGMRSRFGASTPFYTGAVRNFERTDDDRLPESGSRVPNLDPSRPEDVASFRNGLTSRAAYFYHLCEGIDEQTRRHYLNLVGNDLLGESLVAIHCLALQEADLAELNARGCKVVWSPLSNLLLYGQTIDARRLEGLAFALGCDWTPSGSKNLLQELKVAWLSVQEDGAGLSARDLCAAVTRNAAQAAGWGDALGTIERGKYADLLVTDTLRDDPYANLLAATEREVRLMVIAGCPRYGDADLVQRYPPSDGRREELTVGGRDKRLYLEHPQSQLGGLTFAAALAKLEEATSRLHELEAELAGAPFSLSLAADGFQLLLDNDDYPPAEPGEADLLAAAVLPESIPLDPPTVVDDPGWFDRLESIGHLPPVLRKLREFYEPA
ncbi:MAG: amidohydrolase family protein [Egibacteraceae bacterium]